MNQTVDPNSQPNEPRGHKRSRSLGTASDEAIHSVIRVLERFEHTIATETPDEADSEEMQAFLSRVFVLKMALTGLLEERKAAAGKYEVKAVSFSAVQETNLKEMGLEEISVLSEKDFKTFVDHFNPRVVKNETTLKEVVTFLGKQLLKVKKLIVNRNEAAARMTINQFLVEIADFSVRPGEYEGSKVAGWTELSIADQKRPIKVIHGQIMTILTGIADYALGYGLNPFSQDIAQTIATVEKNGPGRDAFILLEAKAVAAKLWEYLRQVVAQSIALTNRAVTKAGLLTPWASFALSNGLEWIFGVIKINPASNMQRKDKNEIYVESIECRCSPMLTMANESDDANRKKIFRALLTWVRIPSKDLWEKIQEEASIVVEGVNQATEA